MNAQSSLLVNVMKFRPAQRTQQVMDGLAYFVQKFKARTSGHMNMSDLKAAFKLAQELEQKAKDIRKAIRQDMEDLENN